MRFAERSNPVTKYTANDKKKTDRKKRKPHTHTHKKKKNRHVGQKMKIDK